MSTSPGTDAFAGVSDQEIKARMERAVSQYDSLIREIAALSIRAGHVRNEIQSMIDETERRAA